MQQCMDLPPDSFNTGTELTSWSRYTQHCHIHTLHTDPLKSYRLTELGSQEAYNQVVWQLKALQAACKTARYWLILRLHEDQIIRTFWESHHGGFIKITCLSRFESLRVSMGQTHGSDTLTIREHNVESFRWKPRLALVLQVQFQCFTCHQTRNSYQITLRHQSEMFVYRK